MDKPARIRINVHQGEFEIEGAQAFVESYAAKIEELLLKMVSEEQVQQARPPEAALQVPDQVDTLGSFGEFWHHAPKSLTEVDQVLVAGYYTSRKSPDKSFSTGEANRHLVSIGVKVGNASQCVRQSINARRVIPIGNSRYRVSPDGNSYLKTLMGGQVI